MAKAFVDYLKVWDSLSIDEKKKLIHHYVFSQPDFVSGLSSLEEPEPLYDIGFIDEMREIDIPDKIIGSLKYLTTEMVVSEAHLVTFWRWLCYVISSIAPYIYRQILIKCLWVRGIWPNMKKWKEYSRTFEAFEPCIPPQSSLSERENLFPVNWSLKGAPTGIFKGEQVFTKDDLILFAISETPGEGKIIFKEVECDLSGIDLNEHLISNGQDTFDYRFRSISECPNFFNKVPGIDVEEEILSRGLPLYSDNPKEMSEIEKIYYDAIRKEINEYKDKLPELDVSKYETYAEFQARVAYDEAYGTLYEFFRQKLGFIYDQTINAIVRHLKWSEGKAKKWIKEQTENMIFDLIKFFEVE